MRTFKLDEKQQKIIAEFFKEETTYFPNHVLMKFLACFLVSLSMIMLIPPFAVWEGEKMLSVFGFYFFWIGIACYGTKYASYAEPLTKISVRITSLLRYVPVEKDQLMLFRLCKILKPCVILTPVVLMFRIAISLGVFGSVQVWDLVLPPLFMIVLPVVFEFISPWGMNFGANISTRM
ncbi:MAG: hypothetical protein K6E50_15820 [Lachnospiraceae bacterium]|nr:hypothetical protein [Lachnospiraceae bacterium]